MQRVAVPLNIAASGRSYFTPPPPGKRQIIDRIVISSLTALSVPASSVQIASGHAGVLFAAGAGYNNPFAVGSYPLYQPLDLYSGENVWADAVVVPNAISPMLDKELGAAQSSSFTVAHPVNAGELVIAYAGLLFSAGSATPQIRDNNSDTYQVQASQAGNATPVMGLTLAASNISNAMTAGVTIIGIAPVASSVPALGAVSILGCAANAASAAYASNIATTVGTGVSVTTSAAVNAGDLVVAVVCSRGVTNTVPGGWTALNGAAANGVSIGAALISPSSTATVTFTSTLSASEQSTAAIAAYPAGIGTNASVALSLAGTEYD